ncbi:hypothetical protein [Peribacillus frigoritolerans]|uniref:hypothetical protein n=1 Tax=Peribacillus frigoritolerans TaxID=450367 RepID=UPI003305C8A1
MNKAEKEEKIEKSKEAAIEFYKNLEEPIDLEVTKAEFSTETNATIVFVYGHDKGNKDVLYHATVETADDYEVLSFGDDKEPK